MNEAASQAHGRDAANRVKNHTGTVHFAENGVPACGPLATHSGWMRSTVEDVTCLRCIAMFGADETTDLRDPAPVVDAHVARRAEERRLRQEARYARTGTPEREVK